MKKFLKVGEFARICGTTKETLLHYDRKGLLKPKYIAGNGYRGYGIEQYFDFDLISLLKEGGASLDEIKKYRNNETNSGYLNLLKEQVPLLEKKQKKFTNRLLLLNQIIEISEESISEQFDTLFFKDQDTMYIDFYKIDSDKMLNRESSVECYSSCLMDSLSSDDFAALPLGSIIPREYAIKKEYKICYFFRNIYDGNDVNFKEIPKGRYSFMFHRGDIESHKNIFNFMINEIKKSGLKILSDVYIYDQMSYVLVGASPDFIAKYVVKVDK